ncbi:ABC transporter permease subunit [Geobacter argillaceus]|uniref:Phosphate transport system permease protein n=1 Tax=Geobacter argillaceus TaxID=345631 RepID=A0A562VGJ7_9BACT|nr:ABC transporter permease subunit [Geobacter argillaceus]TWJ16877.1 phosphate transport system permease protein [Geobacter argillaceus]
MKQNLIERIKRRDRIAGHAIKTGGLLVVASVIGILILIVKVALPLFYPPSAHVVNSFPVPRELGATRIIAAGLDDYRETGYLLDETGTFTFIDLRHGTILDRVPAVPTTERKRTVASVEKAGKLSYTLLWSDGSLAKVQVKFAPGFDGEGKRTIRHEVTAPFVEQPVKQPSQTVKTLVRSNDEKGTTRVDLSADGHVTITRQEITKDIFGTESAKRVTSPLTDPIPGRVSALALDQKGQYLYAGTDRGSLLRWDLGAAGAPQLTDNIRVFPDGRAVTALGLVLGDISIAVGDASGGFATWFPVAEQGLSEKRLKLIHQLSTHQGKVIDIIPSQRDKTLLSLDERGTLHVDHMTSERHLLTLQHSSPLVQIGLSAKGTGLLAIDAANAVTVWQLQIPHPDVSFGTLFGKVWYESYNEPAFVWQSSAANDDFEPKLSLTPLIFGTLKGTFYAMIFAVPLALLGAIYTSQFLNQRTKAIIKPAVEIMAAIPSVVIGFLAGLWLAPLLDKTIVAFFLSIGLIPAAIFIVILFWQRIRPATWIDRTTRGYEFLFLIPAILLGGAVSYYLGGMLEAALFNGDFKLWLYNQLGVRADQRNSIIISLALGFAIIPIIFTIAEDALSNVPKSLSAASLALGASRWQTAWRVVLPSAVPGIFSAIMIGFGRAVGETMIILMATGNTPIMNWSIFNGFRSLSANIAVEIPEAPVAGTLYRVLFLSAVLLFIFTFIVNTVAEVVRQNFRKKYGRF